MCYIWGVLITELCAGRAQQVGQLPVMFEQVTKMFMEDLNSAGETWLLGCWDRCFEGFEVNNVATAAVHASILSRGGLCWMAAVEALGSGWALRARYHLVEEVENPRRRGARPLNAISVVCSRHVGRGGSRWFGGQAAALVGGGGSPAKAQGVTAGAPPLVIQGRRTHDRHICTAVDLLGVQRGGALQGRVPGGMGSAGAHAPWINQGRTAQGW